MLADKIYTNLRAADVRRLLEYVVALTGIAVIYVGLAKLSLALASIHPSLKPALCTLAAMRPPMVPSPTNPTTNVVLGHRFTVTTIFRFRSAS